MPGLRRCDLTCDVLQMDWLWKLVVAFQPSGSCVVTFSVHCCPASLLKVQDGKGVLAHNDPKVAAVDADVLAGGA